MYPRGQRTPLLRPRWDFMSVALLVLGIGSFLFHATLRQTLEFADEFSMLGLTWSMLHAALTSHQPPARARLITAGLAVVYLGFSGFYLWSAKIIYQVAAFELGLAGVIVRSVYVLHWKKPGFAEGQKREWRVRKLKALGVSLLGYLLWNVDLEYCAELRALKAQVGLPWAWLLEFHGWWHILTAVGAALSMQVAREMREAKLVGEEKEE
jgi:dihydroceramidase